MNPAWALVSRSGQEGGDVLWMQDCGEGTRVGTRAPRPSVPATGLALSSWPAVLGPVSWAGDDPPLAAGPHTFHRSPGQT